MLKLILVSALLISSSAFARSGTGGCSGSYRGAKVVLKAAMSDISSLDTGVASVTINNRVLADFEGRDMKINFLARTFTIKNARGDFASGKLTNIFTKSGIMYQISIPSYGIDYRNFPMDCWTKKN